MEAVWQAAASWGWHPTELLWGAFRLVQLSGSSHFLLKTLGLSPPTVLWAPDVLSKELWTPCPPLVAWELGRGLCESINT